MPVLDDDGRHAEGGRRAERAKKRSAKPVSITTRWLTAPDDFRNWLIGALAALVLGMGGFIFSVQAETITKQELTLREHADRITRLEILTITLGDAVRELKDINRELARRP